MMPSISYSLQQKNLSVAKVMLGWVGAIAQYKAGDLSGSLVETSRGLGICLGA